jgi:hypothetical protein
LCVVVNNEGRSVGGAEGGRLGVREDEVIVRCHCSDVVAPVEEEAMIVNNNGLAARSTSLGAPANTPLSVRVRPEELGRPCIVNVSACVLSALTK